MTYCNPVPIAAATYLNKGVVSDGLNALFNGIYDLLNIGRNIMLKFGFCNIYFNDRNLSYNFSSELTLPMQNLMEHQSKFRKGQSPVSSNWKNTAIAKWAKSSLSSVLERPHTPLVKTIDNKSQLLKVMSVDLSTVNKIKQLSLQNYK